MSALFRTLVFAAVSSLIATAHAANDDATLAQHASRTDRIASTGSDPVVVERIGEDFADFAGSRSNAEALVTGLRNGTPIFLGSTTITPQTGHMGYGNVFISLALAQQSLANVQISSPTPDQIRSALTGGTITTADGRTLNFEGVLMQRAAGMGWGQIAHSMGVKLGWVISEVRSGNERLAGATRHERAAKPERKIRPDKPERIEKAERPERPEKPDRPQKPERPERPGKS